MAWVATNFKHWAKEYNVPAFADSDPIQFPRRYKGDKKKTEISAFLTSWLAFGNRTAIVKAAKRLDLEFSENPYNWIMAKQYGKSYGNTKKMYRMLSFGDLYQMGERLHQLYHDFDSMEDMISHTGQSPIEAISAYFDGIRGIPQYSKGSACKRLCMLSRWMVRRDGIVDLGVWGSIDPKRLIIPLDTHVHRIALFFGITKRTQADMKTAKEITDYFKSIFPDDPVLGDFALFGAGINHIDKLLKTY